MKSDMVIDTGKWTKKMFFLRNFYILILEQSTSVWYSYKTFPKKTLFYNELPLNQPQNVEAGSI